MRGRRYQARNFGKWIGLALALSLVLAGCGSYPGATEQSKPVHDLYNTLFIAAAAIFVLVEGLIVWAVLRYRRRDDALPPQFHGHNLLEIAWTVIPMIIVAWLFVISWQVLNKVEAQAAQPDLTVNVTGFQWQWRFTYQGERLPAQEGEEPEDLSISGTGTKPAEVYLPVGETIHFNVEATDVIHSFYVPEFLFKRDAIPGHTNSFDLTISEPGTYHGQCAEFCGLEHHNMTFTIHAVDQARYQAWLEEAKQEAVAGCPQGENPDQISSDDIAFDKECLSAKAGEPFTITFTNKEAVPHNVQIFDGSDANAPSLFDGEVIASKTVEYQVPALDAGEYFFHCKLHPQQMQGTLVVK